MDLSLTPMAPLPASSGVLTSNGELVRRETFAQYGSAIGAVPAHTGPAQDAHGEPFAQHGSTMGAVPAHTGAAQGAHGPYYAPVPPAGLPPAIPAPSPIPATAFSGQFNTACGNPVPGPFSTNAQPNVVLTPGYMVYEPYFGRARFYAPPSSRPFTYNSNFSSGYFPTPPAVAAGHGAVPVPSGVASHADGDPSFNSTPVNYRPAAQQVDSFSGLQASQAGSDNQFPLANTAFSADSTVMPPVNVNSVSAVGNITSSPAIVEIGAQEPIDSPSSDGISNTFAETDSNDVLADQAVIAAIERVILRCPTCACRFRTAKEVDTHRQVHNRLKPYLCLGGCQRAFSRMVGRDAHWNKYPDCKTDHMNYIRSVMQTSLQM